MFNEVIFFLWMIISFFILFILTKISKKCGIEILIGVYGGLVLLANILASKLISIFSLIVPAGVLIYSITFTITDVLSEVYSKSEGFKCVLSGFVMLIVGIISIQCAVHLISIQGSSFQHMYQTILDSSTRIMIGSIVAFIVSQSHDVFMFHLIKKKTNGKYLWLRNNGSTLISQFIDTLIFITIAFYGVVPLRMLLIMILSQYFVKMLIALFDTPIVYLCVKELRQNKEDEKTILGCINRW